MCLCTPVKSHWARTNPCKSLCARHPHTLPGSRFHGLGVGPESWENVIFDQDERGRVSTRARGRPSSLPELPTYTSLWPHVRYIHPMA